MKSFITDMLILAAVSGVVAGVMLLPGKTRCRIEKNWGEVHYDATVTREQATKVLDKLVETGVYNGNRELTHSLRKVEGDKNKPETLVWAMMYEQNYREVLSEQLMETAIRNLHAHVFSNDRLTVELADKVVATADTTEQIDENWGSVLFDPPVVNYDAIRFAQTITAVGGYKGTIHMIPDGQSITYRVERDPASLEMARNIVAKTMQDLVFQTFPDERVQVVLIDRDFKEFDVLIEPNETEPIKRKSDSKL